MQKSGPRGFRSWMLLACALFALPACQIVGTVPAHPAPPESLAPPPAAEEVEPMLHRADAALQEERYADAIGLLEALRAHPDVLSGDAAARVEDLWGRATNALHQQALAAGAVTGAPPAAPGGAAEGDAVTAADLLAQAERFWEANNYGRAVACVDALDPLRANLAEPDRLVYDELRRQVQLATQQVRPLSGSEKERRAHEHLEAGLRARDEGDYVAAAAHLRMASLFGVDLGGAAERKLRRALDDMNRAIGEARTRIAEARQWLAAGRTDEARRALEALRDRGVRMGAVSDELDRLLAQTNEAIARREEAETEERTAQARALLAQAAVAGDSGEYEDAAGPLADLKPLRAYLDQEERVRYDALCDAVEKATGVRPGLSTEEIQALAKRELAAGLEAYDQGRYADAQPHLDRVAKLGVDLGWWSGRKFRRARERVDETLQRLRTLHQTGRRRYEAEDYEGARKVLVEVRDSGIQIGRAEQDDVVKLLAAIDKKQQEQREARRAEAIRLLEGARGFAGRNEYADAVKALTDLGAQVEWLTPAQRTERESLLSSVKKAEARARAQQQIQDTERLAAEASRLLAIRSSVQDHLDACDDAVARQDFDAADAQLADAAAALAGADTKEADALASLGQQVKRKGEGVKAARQRQAHLADVTRQLNELAALAVRLKETDLLGAEAKMKEMVKLARAEGVQLSANQAVVREAIIEALQKTYRVDRWLRPTEYGRLIGLADQYMGAGEPAKAVWALELVTNAGPDMVDEDYRSQAVGKLTAARSAAGQQEAAAARLVDACGACRAKLAAGDPVAAVDGAAAILPAAQKEALSGDPLLKVLDAVVGFLGTDVPGAMKEAPPELRRLVAQQLARARVAIAERLGPLYVAAGRPELAEPYLKVLTTAPGVKPASAEWARDQMSSLERAKARAEEAREEGIADETSRMRTLAARLLELAQSGDMGGAEAARTQLADLRLSLDVRKARNAVARGAYDEAAALIDNAPVDGASERVLADVYKPAAEEVKRACSVADGLAGAEAALEACDVARASELLAGVPDGEALPEPDRFRRDVLASVVESALQLSERHLALAARAEQELATTRAALDAARQRGDAWKAYQQKLTAFLTGEQTASGPLQTLLAQPGGLADFEVAEVRGIVDVLLEEERKQAIDGAEDLLAEALRAYNAADYLGAAEALARLKAHAGFALSERLQKEARNVEEAVQEKEKEARALYDQAVEANRAGDAGRLRGVLDELKAHYAKTAVYRDNM